MDSAIIQDPDGDAGEDFVLTANSAWLTAKNISVHIRMDEQGVAVSLYAKGREDDDRCEMARCHADWDDVELP